MPYYQDWQDELGINPISGYGGNGDNGQEGIKKEQLIC